MAEASTSRRYCRPVIRYEQDGAIGVLTIDRPEAANAQSSALLVSLDEHLRTIEADRSVWAVVDVKTMAWAMSQPVVGGSPLALPVAATLPVGARDWTVDVGKAEVLLVRPGDGLAGPGIWAGPAWDGGPLDADGAHDGSVRVQVKDLEAIAGSSVPAPLTLEAGDLLVAFQPEVFYPFVARVEGGGQ